MWSMKGLRGALSVAAMMVGGSASAYTGEYWNMPKGVTAISNEVYHLHMLMFYVCCAIGVVVFGAMIYSLIMHRRSNHPKPADFHESTAVEIAWTAIPFVILIALAIPAAGTLIKMEDVRGSEMTVKVTGYQWKWHYEYLNEGVNFYSTLSAESNKARQLGSGVDVTTVPNYLVDVDHPLVLPVGKKIRFVITSNDVIHAWWVPAIAVKKDAIPGYINEIWAKIDEPGTYRGVCAELCGRDHGFMPIVVKALPQAEYDAWLAQAKSGKIEVAAAPAASMTDAAPMQVAAAPAAAQPATAPAADGEKLYKAQCAACHQANGSGLPPTFPTLIKSPKANGPVAAQLKQMLNGKPPMPAFGHLSDAELAAIATYTRTSWGNKGGAVTAADVAAARK